MSDGSGADTSRARIFTSQSTLSLAIRINAAVLSRRIKSTIYERSVRIFTGGPGLHLPRDHRAGFQDLYDGTQNLVIMALGASALTLDETLDHVFGKPDADLSIDRRPLRIMVNQLRNAFAHSPWRPKWEIRPKFQKRYEISLSGLGTFVFDAANLNGCVVKPEDVGGLEYWIEVLKYCEQLIPE